MVNGLFLNKGSNCLPTFLISRVANAKDRLPLTTLLEIIVSYIELIKLGIYSLLYDAGKAMIWIDIAKQGL